MHAQKNKIMPKCENKAHNTREQMRYQDENEKRISVAQILKDGSLRLDNINTSMQIAFAKANPQQVCSKSKLETQWWDRVQNIT